MGSATIKLFLVHGDAKRLRTAEQLNWTGLALAAPRSELDELVAREECDRPGVYFLLGVDQQTGGPSVYIGEAESIRQRLKQHLSKDFWSQVIFFVSKDENLTKSHIRYLEGRLIEIANGAARAKVENGQSSGARLPESDRADMETFLEKVSQLLPVLGTDFLVPVSAPSAKKASAGRLHFEVKDVSATGYRTPNGFVVEKGSRTVSALRESAHKYPWLVRSREKLLEIGAIAEAGSHLIFTRDTEFESPSGAAAVVCGGTANGLTSWKDKNGKTLKDIEVDESKK